MLWGARTAAVRTSRPPPSQPPPKPSTKLSFGWHPPVFIPIGTPDEGTGGASNGSLADGYAASFAMSEADLAGL